jgi:hypothetical protein
MEKRPLTQRLQSFAVWHRLLQNLLASPRGPFMVELFTVERFAPDRRMSRIRFGLSPGAKLPTPARLNEVQDLDPPGRDLAASAAAPALSKTALNEITQGWSASPPRSWRRHFHASKLVPRAIDASRLWAKGIGHRIECRDYSVRDALPYKGSCISDTGLLRQASVELDEPVSWHPALRADHMQIG